MSPGHALVVSQLWGFFRLCLLVFFLGIASLCCLSWLEARTEQPLHFAGGGETSAIEVRARTWRDFVLQQDRISVLLVNKSAAPVQVVSLTASTANAVGRLETAERVLAAGDALELICDEDMPEQSPRFRFSDGSIYLREAPQELDLVVAVAGRSERTVWRFAPAP